MTRARSRQRYGLAWVDGRCVSTGKLRYVDEVEATEKIASSMIAAIHGDPTRHECGDPCTRCGGWHLTSRFGGPWGVDIFRRNAS